eukprot:6177913-Pleurochrysis_carterae.AAC.2
MDPVRVNENDCKTARSRSKMEIGDCHEHTTYGVHARASERGGVAKSVTATKARGPRLTLLRRQTHPLKQEFAQWGQ